jgi:hypothetical protein
MAEIDEALVKALFEDCNDRLAGFPMEVATAALQDLITASICYAAPTKAEARELMTEIHEDLQKTIEKNFDHYHNQRTAARASRGRAN